MSRRKRIEVPGTGKAGKTRLSFDRSKVAGEFLKLTLRRSDRDDRMSWHLHFAEEHAALFAMWLLGNLPARTALLLIAKTVQLRPELMAAIRAAGDIEDDNSNDGSQG